MFEIPLTPEPQSFRISINKVEYFMYIKWNNINGSWILDIYDVKEIPIIMGIPLVPNVNLLEQFEYLGFTGKLVAISLDSPSAVPGYNDLGINSKLLYIPNE